MNIPCRWFSARVSLSLVVLVASDVALLVSVLASVPGLVLPCGLLTAAATGLYLANYYSTAARSDSVPQYDPYGNYDPSYSYSRR